MGIITFGKVYRHRLLPEIVGIATARCEYINDEPDVCLECVNNGLIVKNWVNEGHCELVANQ